MIPQLEFKCGFYALQCTADLVFCSVFIDLQDYLDAPNVELLCLVLIFFDEIF